MIEEGSMAKRTQVPWIGVVVWLGQEPGDWCDWCLCPGRATRGTTNESALLAILTSAWWSLKIYAALRLLTLSLAVG